MLNIVITALPKEMILLLMQLKVYTIFQILTYPYKNKYSTFLIIITIYTDSRVNWEKLDCLSFFSIHQQYIHYTR